MRDDDALFAGIDDAVRSQPKLQTIDAVDLLALPFVPPAMIVDHLLPRKATVLLSGDTGGAKTALGMHIAACIAAERDVAGKFPVRAGCRTLYVNGEMGAETCARYVQEAAAGIDATIPRGRFTFEGREAVATWRFGENPSALAELAAELRPDLIILDTQRALLIEDESDTTEVRRVFAWLRTHLVDALGVTVLVPHHLRKIGPVSNSSRERVAGSRDIIASVDVHLAAKSRDGGPLNALRIDKTRTPFDGVTQGTEWAIEARLEPGAPSRSIFLASGAQSDSVAAVGSAEDRAADEIRARLEAEGPLTSDDLGASGGAAKRALERLRKVNEVVDAGKVGRRTLFTLRGSPYDREALL